MNFTDQIRTIADEFPHARSEVFAHHKLANQIRRDWPSSIKALMQSVRADQYQFDASPGLGQWSEAPWLAVLHPSVTDTAMAGFYPVYLFEPGFKTICLVMGQGAKKITEAMGKKLALGELARRAEQIRFRSGNWSEEGFNIGPFQTLKTVSINSSSEVKNDQWSVSVAFGKRYEISNLPSDAVMVQDLIKMLDLYDQLAMIPELLSSQLDDELVELKKSGELPTQTVDGAKKVVAHKKFEFRQRNRKLISEAKKQLGDKCQACTFSFETVYGSLMKGFIEAHHKVPLSSLPAEGAELTPTAADFIVLCSNCHRAIHRSGCPDLETFKKSIRPKGPAHG